jgi:hypothetical protein
MRKEQKRKNQRRRKMKKKKKKKKQKKERVCAHIQNYKGNVYRYCDVYGLHH